MKYNSGYVILDFENNIIDNVLINNSPNDNIKKLFSQKNIYKRILKAIKTNKSILLNNIIFDEINKYKSSLICSNCNFLNVKYSVDITYKLNNLDTITLFMNDGLYYSKKNEIVNDFLVLCVNSNDEVGVTRI